MKKIQSIQTKLAMSSLLVVGLLVSACNKEEVNPNTNSPADIGMLKTGNGAPSGAHYTLNLIGVPKNKTADMTGNNGHRIFVALTGNTKINLSEGDFQVLDGNGTDGTSAFQLPNPDPTNSGTTTYSVYIRALGQPGGSAIIHTCATDLQGQTFCSGDSVLLVRVGGNSQFDNVSRELLYIYADIDADGKVDRIPLFDSRLQDYFWSYDNNGLKLVQLRFYQESTTVE